MLPALLLLAAPLLPALQDDGANAPAAVEVTEGFDRINDQEWVREFDARADHVAWVQDLFGE